MLHNRDPLLTLISDKLLVRDFVASRIDTQYLIPLLWSGSLPNNIPYSYLPKKFVIKTNHGCGYVILVKDKNRLVREEVNRLLLSWLRTNFCTDTYLGSEWAYKHITPRIIVEQFIGDSDKAPEDYKFYCFHGKVEFLTVHYGRFAEHKTRSFDRNFQPYDFKYDFDQWEGYCEKPINFVEMVRIAELLAADFDFMRVDLYNVNGKIYFGELTPYPGGVSTKFLPRYRDYYLGSLW
ncbi:MAG: glycosyltransferase [Candidatus Methanofastidiosum sp.]|nr:glycosyltransferase [Methanofastidiosum sp.]